MSSLALLATIDNTWCQWSPHVQAQNGGRQNRDCGQRLVTDPWGRHGLSARLHRAVHHVASAQRLQPRKQSRVIQTRTSQQENARATHSRAMCVLHAPTRTQPGVLPSNATVVDSADSPMLC